MSNAPRERTPRPSLEDLLRLKRAERPDADFWQDFERGLRHKQLAAIVEPKPWWLGLSLLARRLPLAAWSVPTGAAAALVAMMALGSSPAIHTVKGPAPDEISRQISPETAFAETAGPLPVVAALAQSQAPSLEEEFTPSAPPITEPAPAKTVIVAQAPAPAQPKTAGIVADKQLLANIDERERPATATQPTSLPVATAGVVNSDAAIAIASVSFADWAETQLGQLPHLIDVSFASLRDVLESASATGLVTASISSPAAVEIDPVQLGEPRFANSRQARLLSAPIVAEDTEKSLAHARERVVRRLSDGEELYASVTRWGASGDRLSVRF